MLKTALGGVLPLAAMLSWAAPEQRETTPRAAPTGAISGVVYEGQRQEPLAGVAVSVSSTGRGQGVSASVLSDSRGRYVVRNLPASDGYVVVAHKLGYLDGGLAGSGTPTKAHLPLASGQWISDYAIVMWRAAAIAGRVVDEAGEPLVGLPVRVIQRIPVAGTTTLAVGPLARTDDRGAYRIPNLRPGRYLVNVPSVQASAPRAESDQPSTDTIAEIFPPIFYPGVRLPDDATVVEVGPGGQASGIDFALQPIRAVRVTGRVTSDAGSSAHAILRLLVPGEEDLGLGSEIASALVSSSGAFEFRGVPPGQYIIDAGESVAELVAAETPVAIGLSGQTAGPTTALPVPSAPEGTMLAVKRGDTINGMWAQQRVTVGTSDVNDIAIVLRGTTTVSGGVVWDGARGTAPAIRVEPASGSAHLAAPNPSRSATDRFEVRGLRPAEYFVRIASGAASVAVEGIAIGGVDYTHRPLDTSGGDVANVIVTLTSHTAAVAGAVRDATGHDVSSATVTLFPVDRSLWSRFGFDPPWMRAATVLNGSRYQLTSLAKGDYFIVASPVDSSRTWQNPEFLDEAARGALRISLDWGDTRQQDLVMMRRVNR